MRLSETCGQSAIKEYVTANLEVSRKTGAIFPHLLICGPPEMGKATLAETIAEEFGTLVGFLDASTRSEAAWPNGDGHQSETRRSGDH
jgi:Holliday junction resolvasome RuvABC ATP-dependent DNA helicase subunit